jgi:ATP-binding cassette subfamily C protein CydD
VTTAGFLRRRAQTARRPLAWVTGCALADLGLMVAQVTLLSQAIEAMVLAGAEPATLWPLLGPVPLLILARAAFRGWGEVAARTAGAQVRRLVRTDLVDHLLALGPVQLSHQRSGALSALVVEAVEALDSYYARFLPARTQALLLPLGIACVVLLHDGVSALVLVVTAPLIAVFMSLIGIGAERLNQRQWAELARMSAHILERIQGMTVLKLFNASKREAETLRRIADSYRLATMAVLRVAFLSSLALEFFASLGVAMVAVLIGFRLLDGTLGFGDGLLILLLAPEFYLPLRQLGVHYHARMEAIAAAGRLIDVLDRPPPSSPTATDPPPQHAPRIDIDRVGLNYETGRVGLDQATLSLEAGRFTALVGPSGAGKSSLVSLLLRFAAADSGTIRIDGRPLEAIDPDLWRAAIAWVPQRPHLFKGTLADTLRLGRPDADDETLWRALRRVGAEGFVTALPDQLDHPIGEDGAGLSGGQIRLIAMARAALRDAPVLILDEPTASLDSAAEAVIAQALPELAKGRTTLVIAHRLSTVEAADCIFVLDRGRVVEMGRHAELAAAGGLYAGLLRAGQVLES